MILDNMLYNTMLYMRIIYIYIYVVNLKKAQLYTCENKEELDTLISLVNKLILIKRTKLIKK